METMTIKMFLLAVLGSNIFWIVAGLCSLIISALCMRNLAPVTYTWVTEGTSEAKSKGDEPGMECFDAAFSTLIVFGWIFFWWAILAVIAVYYLVIYGSQLILIIIRGIFKGIDKIIPNISIRIDRHD